MKSLICWVLVMLCCVSCTEEYKLKVKQQYEENQKRVAAETICNYNYEAMKENYTTELNKCKWAYEDKMLDNNKQYDICVQEQMQKPIEHLESQQQEIRNLPKPKENKSTISIEDAFLIWFFFL